jgi:transposase-like protein
MEYMSTDISIKEIREKYGISVGSTLYKWMRKFGVKKPTEKQLQIQRAMSKEVKMSKREQELDYKVKALEKALEEERIRNLALSTLIDVAERDLKISIRKKSGAKQ